MDTSSYWDNKDSKMPTQGLRQTGLGNFFTTPKAAATKRPKRQTPPRAKKPQAPPTAHLHLPHQYELDAPCNPYLKEQPVAPPVSQKVGFVDYEDGVNVHRYTLSDARGCYGKDLISSGSAMLKVWKAFNTPKNWDPEDISLGMHPLACSIRASKRSIFGSGFQFRSSVGILRDVYAAYFNLFSAHPFNVTPERPYMSFAQRKQTLLELQASAPKDFSQFVPGSVFQAIEKWLVADCPSSSPFGDADPKAVDLLVSILNCPHRGFGHIQHPRLQGALVGWAQGDTVMELEGSDIADLYGIAAEAGTALHAYLEHRLTDLENHTPEISRAACPCREEEDYIQAEQYIEWVVSTGRVPQHLEKRVASYRHKVSGSLDVAYEDEHGVWHISDHKRSPKFAEYEWFRAPGFIKVADLSTAPLSSPLIGYAIQFAVYRKLLLLDGKQVSPIVHWNVFHPSFETFAVIKLDLNQKMKKDDKGQNFHRLGVDKHGDSALQLSPTEFVELLFEFIEEQLQGMEAEDFVPRDQRVKGDKMEAES